MHAKNFINIITKEKAQKSDLKFDPKLLPIRVLQPDLQLEELHEISFSVSVDWHFVHNLRCGLAELIADLDFVGEIQRLCYKS